MKIEVFIQSAIKLTNKKIIYFDPFKIIKEYHDADYIFITHDHYDHFDIESINKVIKENTLLIVPKCLKEKISKLTKNILVVDCFKEYKVDDIMFRTIPAYNINKKFHPKEKEYVGYNILLDGKYYYIMGDTDVTDDALNVKCDVCFVPIGGTYTMNLEEAVNYINSIKPKKAIPIHYGSIVGDISLGEKFKNLVSKDIEVEIYLKEEK